MLAIFVTNFRFVWNWIQFDYLENELMFNIPDGYIGNNHCIKFVIYFSLSLFAFGNALLQSWVTMWRLPLFSIHLAYKYRSTAEHLHCFSRSRPKQKHSFEIDILCEYQFSHFNLCKTHCECSILIVFFLNICNEIQYIQWIPINAHWALKPKEKTTI